MRNAYRILVGKSEGKRPLGRPRRSWVENIKMDLTAVPYLGKMQSVLEGEQTPTCSSEVILP
jgi:hypothetical protein